MLNFRGVRVHVTSNRYWTNHTPQKINGWNLKITKQLKFGKSSSNHPPPFFGGSSTPEFSRDPVVTSNHQTQQQLVFVTNLPGLGQGVQGWPVDSSLARRRPWRYSRTAPEKFNPLESAQKLVGLGGWWMLVFQEGKPIWIQSRVKKKPFGSLYGASLFHDRAKGKTKAEQLIKFQQVS